MLQLKTQPKTFHRVIFCTSGGFIEPPLTCCFQNIPNFPNILLLLSFMFQGIANILFKAMGTFCDQVDAVTQAPRPTLADVGSPLSASPNWVTIRSNHLFTATDALKGCS